VPVAFSSKRVTPPFLVVSSVLIKPLVPSRVNSPIIGLPVYPVNDACPHPKVDTFFTIIFSPIYLPPSFEPFTLVLRTQFFPSLPLRNLSIVLFSSSTRSCPNTCIFPVIPHSKPPSFSYNFLCRPRWQFNRLMQPSKGIK